MAVEPATTPERTTDFLPSAILLLLREQRIKLLLVVVIIERLIKLLARLHAIEQVLLRALLAQRVECSLRGGGHHAEGGQRVKCHRKAGGFHLGECEEWRLTEFRQVRQDGNFDRRSETAVFVERRQSFGEDHVGPR